ncbi:MAG: helix-turn-helix domain-containing protein [Clostridia bacterium]|nr:helix-turn-helix domain-containing protein [Clostridia bacterium]
MNVLERIMQLRLQRGWTEYRLSEESGIAQTTISSWFKKDITPSVPSLENICKAFNITLSKFFAFDNQPVVLTMNQKNLIESFSRLNDLQQNIVLDLINNMNLK